MTKEVIILASAWIVMAILLVIYVPKNKLREAQVTFFFKQLMTWITGLAVVQYGLIEYPVREFSNATRTSFTFEYFIYPSLCVLFNLCYPIGKSPMRQFAYYFFYTSSITVIEVLCERYTEIIKYIHWTWYITWITIFITFYISRKYYEWFFQVKSPHATSR